MLLEVAAEEFANHGFHDTKVSTIVKRANVTQPTFYLYFQNKEAIFQELIQLFRQRLADLTKNSRLEPDVQHSLSENIKKGLREIFTFFNQNPFLTKIGFFTDTDAEEVKRLMAAQVKSNLEAEVKLGYFQQDLDMDTVANSLVGTIERLTLTKLFTKQKTPDELAEEIVQLFLFGLKIED